MNGIGINNSHHNMGYFFLAMYHDKVYLGMVGIW